MGHTFHAAAGRTGFVAVATQVGYALGLLLFVPLGDVMERRALMMRMYGGVAVGLLLVAAAPSLMWMILGSVLIGMLASVTHIALPIAADVASDAQRGRAIGIVMTGLLLGILLARTFAGVVARIHGWRLVFVVAAVINLSFVPLMWKMMPKLPPKQALSYGDAMRSLWTLARTQPLLRESSVMGALVFGSFSCFWTTLAFMLGHHYGLGPGVAGSFGVVGAAGALVAPFAGRFADKRGARQLMTAGIITLAASYGVLWLVVRAQMSFAMHMVGLVFGVVLLDAAAQLCQIANQTRIFGLVPTARSRINTIYMTIYFMGAALGSALATVAWTRWQWDGVCALAFCLITAAALRHIFGQRDGARGAGVHNPIEDAVLEA